MAGEPIQVDRQAFRAFARDLRGMGREWPRELRRAHKDIAADVASKAQGAARGMGGVQAKAASAITGRATQSSAKIGINSRPPMAPVAFWGAKKRTGWNARNPDSSPQHPSWVGASWDVGGPGGPYAINPTIAAERDQIANRFGDLIDTLARRAGFK